MTKEKEYISVIGRQNIISAAGVSGYLLSLQDSGIVSKVCGPNSHACEVSIYEDKSFEQQFAFITYFGKDKTLFEMCKNYLEKDKMSFVDKGGDFNKPAHHPNIPPAKVCFGGVEVFRARISTGAEISNHLENMKKHFNKYQIQVYKTPFDDSDVEQFKYR